jgi:hypothetical protein
LNECAGENPAGTKALKPVYDQMIQVITIKQQWISSGYNPYWYTRYSTELGKLDKMKLPTSGVVAAQNRSDAETPY